MIKKLYKKGEKEFRSWSPWIQVPVIIGGIYATGMLVHNTRKIHPLIELGLDLTSFPFRVVYSVTGDIVGVVFPPIERATDELVGDWDGDGQQEGALNEFGGMIA